MTASAKNITGQDMEPKKGCITTRSKPYLTRHVVTAVGTKHHVTDIAKSELMAMYKTISLCYARTAID